MARIITKSNTLLQLSACFLCDFPVAVVLSSSCTTDWEQVVKHYTILLISTCLVRNTHKVEPEQRQGEIIQRMDVEMRSKLNHVGILWWKASMKFRTTLLWSSRRRLQVPQSPKSPTSDGSDSKIVLCFDHMCEWCAVFLPPRSQLGAQTGSRCCWLVRTSHVGEPLALLKRFDMKECVQHKSGSDLNAGCKICPEVVLKLAAFIMSWDSFSL